MLIGIREREKGGGVIEKELVEKRDHELDAKRKGELGTSETKREQGIWERRDMKVVY